jgi:hypothetical protein
MDTGNQFTNQFGLWSQRIFAWVWYLLRSPALTGVLLLILVVVLVLRVTIPQQASPDTIAVVWATSLPPLIQRWSGLFYALGFSRLFQAGWFWIVLGLLLLNSLVALADYTRPTWGRVRNAASAEAIVWRHPLAHRAEQTVRLPENADGFLARLKETLRANGFTVSTASEDNSRLVSAARWRWVWFGILTFYSGLVLLCAAFWVSYQSLENERFRLFPGELETSRLLDGSLELTKIEAATGSGWLMVNLENGGTSEISWRLYRPTFLADLLILPVGMEPAVVVEAAGAAGEPLRLMPLREDLSPAVRLNLPLDRPEEALYFHIPPAALTFKLSPVSASSELYYDVQVKRGPESALSDSLVVKPGEPFEVDEFSLTASPSHRVTIDARRDLALPLYAVSFTLLAVSGFLLVVFSPRQVWLVPEVKGRGGQLYGTLERFGLARGANDCLDQLLDEHATATTPKMPDE